MIMDDHIHLLVGLHTTVSVSNLVKEGKGSSSHFITHVMAPGIGFKWQGAYGAFTIRKCEVTLVCDYISHQ
jgi:putative transposase